MRALVTGAGGFVGANLAAHLLRDGHEVHAVCHVRGDEWRLTRLRDVRTHHADLVANGTARGLMQEVTPDWVFHLAAYGAYSWQTEVPRIIATNLNATVALVDAAEEQGVRAFINAGSSSEYGFKDHAPGEDELPDPNSAYAVSKVAATMYCRYRALAAGLPAITLRLYSVYGALEDHRRLIPTLIKNGMNGRLPPLAGPDTARDFVYVEDVCKAFVQAAERSEVLAGGVYNIGSGRQMTLRQLVDYARVVMAIPVEPTWGSYPQHIWDTNVWYASIVRAAGELGWSAETGIEDGLLKTIAKMSVASDGPASDGRRMHQRISAPRVSRQTSGLYARRMTTDDIEIRGA
jgi:UDP-glucose 4-epimerase